MLPGFVGSQPQRVPALAAVRVDGERLYRRARRGEEVEAPERDDRDPALRLVEDLGDGVVELEVRCGAGTYVRRWRATSASGWAAAPTAPPCGAPPWASLSVDDAVAPEEVAPRGA